MSRYLFSRVRKVLLCLLALPFGSVFSAPGDPDDLNLVYIGRWIISDPSAPVGSYGGAYVMTCFTGPTIALKLNEPAPICVEIDGGAPVSYDYTSGLLNLTPVALGSGTHHIRVTLRAPAPGPKTLEFAGFVLASGGTTTKPLVKPMIEFIGDSITAGYGNTTYALSSFAWKTAEYQRREHTQIATPGISLVDNPPSHPSQKGMESQFEKDRELSVPGGMAWDFNRYQPEMVVIHLGTNDFGYGVSGAVFQSRYILFLQKIRTKYPNAKICALRTFTGKMGVETQAAVQARNAAGDSQVYFLDSTGWWQNTPALAHPDGHPNDFGHTQIASYLTQKLEEVFAPRFPDAVAYVTVDSTHGANSKNLAIDGNTYSQASRWVSANTAGNHHYKIDYVEDIAISKVRFWSGAASGPGNHIQDCQLQYWIKGASAGEGAWHDFGDPVDDNDRDGFLGQSVERVHSSPVVTQKLRLLITKAARLDNHARLMEIQINPSQ